MPYLYRRSYIGVLSSWWYWILMFDNILLISLWFHSDFRCQHQQCYKIPYRNIIFTVNYLNKIVWVRITFLIKRRHNLKEILMLNCELKEIYPTLFKKKKKSRKSDTWKQLKSCSKHDIPHLSYGDGLYTTMTNW